MVSQNVDPWCTLMGRQNVGVPEDGTLGRHTEAVERETTAISCDVNKLVKSPLHSEKPIASRCKQTFNPHKHSNVTPRSNPRDYYLN